MGLVALVLSLCVAALGAFGVVSPAGLLRLARRFDTPRGLWAAAAFRLALGAALILTAPDARAPEALLILGVVIVLAGLATPLFGVDRFRRLLGWWAARGPIFTRVWAGAALALGLWLVWAVAP